MMLPKKKVVERAINNGSIDRVNQLISAAHLLMCEACNLYSEADEVMAKNGLMLGEIKQKRNLYHKYENDYLDAFAQIVAISGQKMELFTDLDKFDDIFRKMANLNQNEQTNE